MATVTQFDKTALDALVNEVEVDPTKLPKLINFLKTSAVSYSGDKNSILAVSQVGSADVNISKTPPVVVVIRKNPATDVHELFVDGGLVAKLAAKVPPRQG